MERREFLRVSLGAVIGLPVVASVLSSCETDVNKVRGQVVEVDISPYPMLNNVGGMAFVQVDNYSFILRRASQTTIVAFSAVCPHQGCLIGDQMGELHHHKIRCMCHGAEFNPQTGAVTQGPATTGLTQYQTEFDPQSKTVKIYV